jgi:hypothetical protein
MLAAVELAPASALQVCRKAKFMAIRRCYLQFSLRGFLVSLTAFAIWLSVIANRAREQQEAVKAIEAMGGAVYYDWQIEYEHSEKPGLLFSINHDKPPPGPDWLRRLIGAEFFQDAEAVFLDQFAPEGSALNAIPRIQQLRTVRILSPPRRLSAAARAKFKASLSVCEDW